MRNTALKEIKESYSHCISSVQKYQPDYDDIGEQWDLKNGITLTCLLICNGEICEDIAFEGLDGWLYIDNIEELLEVMTSSYEEVLEKISRECISFDKSNYI